MECLKFLVKISSDLGLKEAGEYALELKKAERARELKESRISSSRSGSRMGSSQRNSRNGSAVSEESRKQDVPDRAVIDTTCNREISYMHVTCMS